MLEPEQSLIDILSELDTNSCRTDPFEDPFFKGQFETDFAHSWIILDIVFRDVELKSISTPNEDINTNEALCISFLKVFKLLAVYFMWQVQDGLLVVLLEVAGVI